MRHTTRSLALILAACCVAACPNREHVAAEAPPGPPPMSDLSAEQQQVYEEYKALALQNDCSGGYRGLGGRWRFVGESRMPDYASEIAFEGTRYTETLRGRVEGRLLEARIEGELRCLFRNRVLMTVERVSPEGAFDNRSGDAYPCDVLGDMDPSHVRILLICYFDWDLRAAAGREFEYERID
jgi:hypothetical protein